MRSAVLSKQMLPTFDHGKSRIANPFATSTRAPEESPPHIRLLRRPTVDTVQLGSQRHQFLEAVRFTVPQEMWGDIVENLDQVERHPEALDVDIDDFDGDDDSYDPTEFIDEDDEF
jgi:hypothetical protein